MKFVWALIFLVGFATVCVVAQELSTPDSSVTGHLFTGMSGEHIHGHEGEHGHDQGEHEHSEHDHAAVRHRRCFGRRSTTVATTTVA
ncbi:hypothetical protein CHUAL_011920 [Chamberlinius hualienensis]